MASRRTLVFLIVWSFVSHTAASEAPHGPNAVEDQYQWRPSSTHIHLRQVPVVVAPPSASKPASSHAPLIPQPTSSLNYWWPYGSNGVDPTATSTSTPTPTSNSDTTDSSSSLDDASNTTTTDEATMLTSSSSNESPTATTTSETQSKIPKQAASSDIPKFQVISLLPLFIILGVILLATLIGWTYGRCVRWCQRRKEPASGEPSTGRRPYEFGGFDSDTIQPMRPTGMGWVDASRIYEQNTSPGVVYYAVRTGQQTEEPGTPSKNKARIGGGGWFRHTFSRKQRPNENSPSGEKGLNPSSVDNMQPWGALPPLAYGQVTSQRVSFTSTFGPPKLLRAVNGSASAACSPTTSIPHITTSRHGSLRRKLVEKVRAEGEGHLLAASAIPGAFGKIEDADKVDNWADFRAEPLKRSPARRYTSDDSTKSPHRLTRSPDPQKHRARMRRLRAAAAQSNVAAPGSVSPTRTLETFHPLPPSCPAVLSSPLQPNLFFTGHDQHDTSPKTVGFSPARNSRSRNLKGRTAGPFLDDPFGPVVSAAAQPMQRANGKGKLPEMGSKSTRTVPLSPELRGAAMTRFEEIVKTSWSMRDLPQSPTMYGALSPLLGSHTFYEDEDGREPKNLALAGCEQVLS